MSVESLLAKVGEGFHAGRSFGPVIEGDGCLIVPVAITAGGGGGGGQGRTDAAAGDAGGKQDADLLDGGGGFGGVSWPVGVYVIKDGDARWVPAFDATRVAIGIIALMRVIAPVARRRARKKALRAID